MATPPTFAPQGYAPPGPAAPTNPGAIDFSYLDMVQGIDERQRQQMQTQIMQAQINFTRQVYNSSSQDILRLQQGMEAAGILSPGGYLPGAMADQSMWAGITQLTHEAALMGMSPTDWMNQRAQLFQQQTRQAAEEARKARAQQRGEDRFNSLVSQFENAYFQLWGTFPPEGQAESAARSMNIHEWIARQRRNPAFKNTQTYQMERISIGAQLHQLLGSAV